MKLHKLLAMISLLLGLSACELDFAPTAAVADSNLTEDDYQYLLVGVYNGAQSFSMGILYVIDDVASDNLNCRSWYPQVDQNNLTSNISNVNSWWEQLYGRVQRANNLISLLESKESPTTREMQMMAEARVIRAWLYMRIVGFWGDAPYLTKVTNDLVPRSPEADIWNLIKEDCEYAMNNGPEFSIPGQVSNISAKAMLARTLLIAQGYVQDKAEAAKLAIEVINDGRFNLANDYADIWHTKTSSEFLLQWTNISGNSGSPGWFLRSNLVNNYESFYGAGSAGYGELGRYEFPIDQSMMNAFEPEDVQRKSASVRHLSLNGSDTYDCVKLPSYDGADSWPVARIAEMYLVAAEGLGYPAGVNYLNLLREKRGLSALVAGEDITADNFIEKIMQERRVELLCEGHRWYDLRRWFNMDEAGRQAVLDLRCYQAGEVAGSRPHASEKLNIADDGYNLLWPVPAVAIENNPNLLPNNTGY